MATYNSINDIPEYLQHTLDMTNPGWRNGNTPTDAFSGKAITRPDYIPGYDPNKTSIWGNLQKSGPFAQMQAEAQRTGPSRYANMADQQQAQLAMQSRNSGAASAGAQAAAARTSLGARGGLDSGARERLAQGAATNSLNMGQDVNKNLSNNMMTVGLNDEQNRISQLGTVAGQQAAAQGQDVTNQINETQAHNTFNMGAYQEQMKTWAAKQQANATAQSGGSSWLCTESNKTTPLSASDKICLSALTNYGMKRDKAAASFYLRDAHELIKRMHENNYDWEENTRFVRAVITFVAQGQIARGWEFFREVVVCLIETYWPECNDPGFLKAREDVRQELAQKAVTLMERG